MDCIADRLRAQRSVDEEVDSPAACDAEAEAAAILEPILVSDRWHHKTVASNSRDDAGMVRKGLYEPAIDVAFDTAAEQVRPLTTDLDEVSAVGTRRDGGVEWIKCHCWVAVAVHALPQLPNLY